jgi:hypothetical protein
MTEVARIFGPVFIGKGFVLFSQKMSCATNLGDFFTNASVTLAGGGRRLCEVG